MTVRARVLPQAIGRKQEGPGATDAGAFAGMGVVDWGPRYWVTGTLSVVPSGRIFTPTIGAIFSLNRDMIASLESSF